MLGKVEIYDDEKKKKYKKIPKKVKKGKATGKISPAPSRIAITNTLHTPSITSIPESTEEEEEDEVEREQNAGGDLFRKKEDLKSVSGKLRCAH